MEMLDHNAVQKVSKVVGVLHSIRYILDTHFLSLGYLPSGRSKSPSTQLLTLLCLFFEFPVSVLHHSVHELLSRSSSFFHSFLQGSIIFLCNVSYPVLLPYSNYVHQRSFLFHAFQYFVTCFVLCPTNPRYRQIKIIVLSST